MPNYYCEYCGTKSSSVSNLTSIPCSRHPEGPNKGRHKLYEGIEKFRYTCKFCGTTNNTIANLTSIPCSRHPLGSNKGKHAPAL